MNLTGLAAAVGTIFSLGAYSECHRVCQADPCNCAVAHSLRLGKLAYAGNEVGIAACACRCIEFEDDTVEILTAYSDSVVGINSEGGKAFVF